VELRALRHYLERHPGKPRSVAWTRLQITPSFEEAWKRLASPEGLLRQGSLENLREGDRYEIEAATGDTFEGVVQVLRPPRDFSATVENLNQALLRVHLEELLGVRQVWFWLSTYGLPQAEVDAFRGRWHGLLRSLFPQGEGRPFSSGG
jgi:hypothetical protein